MPYRPGRLTSEPERRLQRSAGEDRPVACPVAQTQLLARAREEHRVLADDIAAADDREPDLALPPRPDPPGGLPGSASAAVRPRSSPAARASARAVPEGASRFIR